MKKHQGEHAGNSASSLVLEDYDLAAYGDWEDWCSLVPVRSRQAERAQCPSFLPGSVAEQGDPSRRPSVLCFTLL